MHTSDIRHFLFLCHSLKNISVKNFLESVKRDQSENILYYSSARFVQHVPVKCQCGTLTLTAVVFLRHESFYFVSETPKFKN